MMTISATVAINFALAQDWDNAISANEKLLDQNPEDIDTLNRLAFAYMKKGTIKKAKTFYKKVLALDAAHPIASKMIKRLDTMPTDNNSTPSTVTSPFIFLEEPGRTKIVTLCKVAPHKVLFSLTPGHKVSLVPKRFAIEVRDNKTYIGALPDDISHRLLPLLNGGNEYETYINHTDKNEASVFIKEVKRAKKFHSTASFINTVQSNYTPFIREDLLQSETEFEPGELGQDEENA